MGYARNVRETIMMMMAMLNPFFFKKNFHHLRRLTVSSTRMSKQKRKGAKIMENES